MVPTITLWVLRDARHPGRIEHALSRWARSLRELSRAESGAAALLTIFRYLSLVVQDLSPQTILAALVAAAPETKDTLMPTLAEHWKDEGRAEGLAKGLAEGRVEGRAEGARQVLLRLLELKFGALDVAERARIDEADEADLARWAARVLTAGSVAEALAP